MSKRLVPVDVEVRHPVGVVLSVRLPGELAIRINKEARASGLRMSDFIRRVLQDYFDARPHTTNSAVITKLELTKDSRWSVST